MAGVMDNQLSGSEPIFEIFEDGTHQHNLVDKRTEFKLSDKLHLLLKSQLKMLRDRNEEEDEQEVSQIEDAATLKNESIGYGSSGTVRLARKINLDDQKVKCYAIKEYRRQPKELFHCYRSRSNITHCITSCLDHINILNRLESVIGENGMFCDIMTFCDLATVIFKRKKLVALEADCFFKQLILGLDYLHWAGVAHRDLRPDNLLITSQGVLKIANFGHAQCFRLRGERKSRQGLCPRGTFQFMSPEQFSNQEFDAAPVDVWAAGLIYMTMRLGKLLWNVALRQHDDIYRRYLDERETPPGFSPIKGLENDLCELTIYWMLEPVVPRRPTIWQIVTSRWCSEMEQCSASLSEE